MALLELARRAGRATIVGGLQVGLHPVALGEDAVEAVGDPVEGGDGGARWRTRWRPWPANLEPWPSESCSLRAVNVGGATLPMARLKAIATDLGATDVSTYIASGNLLCTPPGKPADFDRALEQAIEAEFGFFREAISRTPGRAAEGARRPPLRGGEAELLLHHVPARRSRPPRP